MNSPLLILCLSLFTFSNAQINSTDLRAPPGVKLKETAFTAHESLNRIETLLIQRNMTVFARIQHHINAEATDITLRPTELLIFGNPVIGTQLLSVEQMIGLDLPMKILAWDDAYDRSYLAYNHPKYLIWRYHVHHRSELGDKMETALNSITDAVAGTRYQASPEQGDALNLLMGNV